MADKCYKSYRQMLRILRSRGMTISNGSRAIRILEQENYYNVINGYKDPFLQQSSGTGTEKYKTGVTFEEVYALYSFDRELRNTYLKYLLKIENMFKSVIAHEFSSKYGHDNYLKVSNFDDSTAHGISDSVKLIGDIQQEIARQMKKNHQVVTHYMTEHGYIPLWVLVNVLTFGKIENFYKNMKPADKILIAKQFCLQPEELQKFMHILTLARNKCAHDERFYDIRFRERIHTKSIKNFSVLALSRASDGSYTHGTNDAYSIAIMFALLLNRNDTKEFVSAMRSHFTKLNKQLNTISAQEIMTKMGYENTWDNLLKLI